MVKMVENMVKVSVVERKSFCKNCSIFILEKFLWWPYGRLFAKRKKKMNIGKTLERLTIHMIVDFSLSFTCFGIYQEW